MRPLINALVLGVLLFSVGSQGGPLDDQLMDVRLQSFEVIAGLLSEHNPYLSGAARGERQKEVGPTYQSLRRQAPTAVANAVTKQVKIIEDRLEALEKLPESDQTLKPNMLNAILAAHYRVDKLLSEVDGDLEGNAGPVQQIDQLNLAFVRLGLLYQTRLFSGLMVHADESEGDVIGALDTQIMALFEQLQRSGFDQQPLLQRSKLNYRFVRVSLLDQHADWVPNAASLYLNKAMRSLAELRESL